MKRVLFVVLALIMALSVFACNNDAGNVTPPILAPSVGPEGGLTAPGGGLALEGEEVPAEGMFAALEALQERFPVASAEGRGIGGVLNYAIVSPSYFAGVLNPALYITTEDGLIIDFMYESLLQINAANMFSQNGAARYEFDREAATFTMHFNDGVNMLWHDGVPVTMYDLEYAYHLVAHPEVITGRFGAANNTSTVLGVLEYREQSADRISGIRVFNDGRSIEFSYESLAPTMLFGGIWTRPLPKHLFETVPFAEVINHPYSRSDIIGNGAFMFSSIIPGEAVSLVANPNYWQGAPRLSGINLSVIDPAMLGEAMLIGEYDIALFNPVHLPDYEPRLTNVTFISALERRFDYLGFRYGFFDDATQTVTPNPDTIVNCIDLRRALAYGRDDFTTAETVHNGLRFPIATTLIPWQGDFMRTDMVGFSRFDQDLANQILDAAGYEWRSGERFRRHKDTGEPFEIVWAISLSPTNALIVPHHIQDWADIGLNVVLYKGDLMEHNERLDTLRHDRDEGAIHMFDSAWNFGANPNPRGLWGVTALNDTRYQSPRLDAIMDAIESEQAWDRDWLIEQYYEWQMAVYEEAPWIPLLTAVRLEVVNNRVLNFSLARGDGASEIGLGAWHLWDLSQAAPFTAR